MKCLGCVVIRMGCHLPEFSLSFRERGAWKLSSVVLELLRSLSHGVKARPS